VVADDRDGRIESALQMFGSVTFWMFWDSGCDALCSLDDDGDAALSGRELERLALWHANVNGVSDRGEVRSLAAHDIVALSCRHSVVPEEDSLVAAYSTEGVWFRDGSTSPTRYSALRSSRRQSNPARASPERFSSGDTVSDSRRGAPPASRPRIRSTLNAASTATGCDDGGAGRQNRPPHEEMAQTE
jgi:hypothetical protein